MIDNRPEASPSGLSGKRETWIITNATPDNPVIITEGITAFEAWVNAAGAIFRAFGEALPFHAVRVESPAAYHKRVEAWSAFTQTVLGPFV